MKYKYKFIGTEQDLIDNGFEVKRDIQRAYRNDIKGAVYINCDEVVWGDEHSLNDLIDKGLVVEV